MHLDAHEKPPLELRTIYKKYQKCPISSLKDDTQVVDFQRGLSEAQDVAFLRRPWHSNVKLKEIFDTFIPSSYTSEGEKCGSLPIKTVFESLHLPGSQSFQWLTVKHILMYTGLVIVPDAIPIEVQQGLLDRCFHRDLANPLHLTNVDLHYHVPRPVSRVSYFSGNPNTSSLIQPIDPAVHKPITTTQFLNKKLRWMTLGGQYDWTRKVYPDEIPPHFPHDTAELLKSLFPDTTAEAAIINLYSSGDTLSLHRDVSEECDRGLISLSIGCDCLFLVGLGDSLDRDRILHLTLRLRSGDIVYMTGQSRFAWHSVPLIIPNTCPEPLRTWPASGMDNFTHDYAGSEFNHWAGWMASKRVNLNVRQMRA